MAIETSPQCRRLSGPHLSLGAQQPLDPHGPLYRKEFDQAALIRCFSLKMANRTQLRAEPQQMDLVHPAAVLFELLGGLGSPASRPSAALMGRSEPVWPARPLQTRGDYSQLGPASEDSVCPTR